MPPKDETGRRLDRLEQDVRDLNTRITDLHNSSMEWVNQMLTDIREVIREENARHAGNWFQIGITVLATVLSVVGTEIILHWH